jgi:hypothetical protein
LNDIIDPSGAGKSIVNDPAPLELSGASASTERIAARLKLNPREVPGPFAATAPTRARARSTEPADTSANGSAFGCGVSTATPFPGATPTTDANTIAAPTIPFRTRRVRIVPAENILPPLEEQPRSCSMKNNIFHGTNMMASFLVRKPVARQTNLLALRSLSASNLPFERRPHQRCEANLR